MGVRGLFTYLKLHPHARQRRLYLRDLARATKEKTGGEKPKLLCDFFSVIFWLLSEFHEAKVKCGDYTRFSYLYGGDIAEYCERFLAFVKALRHLEIEPEFYIDGARGSDAKGFQAKLETHKSRHYGKMGRVYRCTRVAKYDPREEVETYSTWSPHPLVVLQIMMALKSEGVALIHCTGEADAYLAEQSQRRQEEVCGILTNDTDLVVMRGCEVFLCNFFDREQTLGIESIKFNSRPSDVVCEKLTPQRLARELSIPQDDLKDLSIICGNDYTQGLNTLWELHKKMGLDYPIIESAAKWLRETPHSQLHETPPFKEINESSEGKYLQAIQHTYDAYEGTVSVSGHYRYGSEQTPFYENILVGLREGKMTRELLSIAANGIHWRIGVVETLEEAGPTLKRPPCIDDLLLPIRQIVYKLLGLRTVTEHGRTGSYLCKEIKVKMKKQSINLLQSFIKRTKLEKVCLLTTFLTKAYQLKDVKLDELFGEPMREAEVECALVASLLKLVVVSASLLFSYDLSELSSSFNPELTTDVFLITSIMCFLGKAPRKVLIRPTPEATDIATGFACIIEHSYHLASLLGLFEVMPLPVEVYQSAALVPFFYLATCRPSQPIIKHQLRANKEMAETYNAFESVKKLRSFKKLKDLIEEIYRSSKSCLESVSPSTVFSLAIAFLEVMADVDEADKRSELFISTVQEQQGRHKGKSMLIL